ncbi:hypothetical protein [Aeromonas sp. A35_P]|uniref:hypothetical protein n=1 Tax=Aeromonas sp. A35_P TaxID=1983805 RepID=UPI0011401F99|nr:hypothetical protein [Aeromonas sp. A35_P]
MSPSGLAKSGVLVSSLRTDASLVTIFIFESGWQCSKLASKWSRAALSYHSLLLAKQSHAAGEGANHLLYEGLFWLFKRSGKALKFVLCPWGMATIDGGFL